MYLTHRIDHEAADFSSRCLAPGVDLHIRQTDRFKSFTIDLFLAQELEPVANTRLALAARLLERGTTRLPSLRDLNRHTDWLFGAALSAQAIGVGPFQVLHLHFDAVSDRFVPDSDTNLLEEGVGLIGDALTDPLLENGAFPADRVEQEKTSLQRYVDGIYQDRSALAQRRALQRACADSPWSLAAHGDIDDLPGLHGGAMLADLRRIVEHAPMNIYVCGAVDEDQVETACNHWLPASTCRTRIGALPALPPAPAEVDHCDDVEAASQGRLVMVFRCAAALLQGDQPMATLTLLNLVLGADLHSRLYVLLREELGLCYHIGSWIEPSAGLLVVEAGIEPGDRCRVVDVVLEQIRLLAESGPAADDLQRSRGLAQQRLSAMADGRDGLVRFHYNRTLAFVPGTRHSLTSALHAVQSQDVADMAGQLRLQTDYLLKPDDETTDDE